MLLPTRFSFLILWSLAMMGAFVVGGPESSFALDPLPRSPRVGALRIPLQSYDRVSISKLLSSPTNFHMREIRIAGTIRAIDTELMTRGCGKPYELTIISLEDDTGVLDILDQGACGRNTGVVRAPMLSAGDRIDLLVHIVGGTDRDSLQVFTLWIERVQD